MESLFIFKTAIDLKHLHPILLLISFSSAILLTSGQWLHNMTTEKKRRLEREQRVPDFPQVKILPGPYRIIACTYHNLAIFYAIF